MALAQIGPYGGLEDLVFGLATAAAATLVILLDWVFLKFRGKSMLGIAYGSMHPLAILLLWAGAAGVVGGLASVLAVVSNNVQGALAVAVSWPLLFERIVLGQGESEHVQLPSLPDTEA